MLAHLTRRLGAATASVVVLAGAPAGAETRTFTLQEATIDQIQQATEDGAISSVELVTKYLARISVYDQNRGGVYLNSMPVPNPKALEEAAAADELRAQGQLKGPLHGLPVAIKDSMAVKDLPFTHSEKEFVNLKASNDAFLVTKLRESGAVILGKANLVRGAGGSGNSDTWGQAKRAHDATGTLEPAGSSSGSSIAVSANLAVLGIGGETGSSIRWPATHQGIVGIRPTKSGVSGTGTFALSPDRDVLGPMARTVKDAAYCLDALWFRDPEDKLAYTNTAANFARSTPFGNSIRNETVAGKRFGVISVFGSTDRTKHVPRGTPVPGAWNGTISDDVYNSFEAAKAKLVAAGAILVEVDLPAATAWYATNFDPANTAALAAAFAASEIPADVNATNGTRQRSRGPRIFYWEDLFTKYGNGAVTTFDQYAQTGNAVTSWGPDLAARLAEVQALRDEGLAVGIEQNPYHLAVVAGWRKFYELYYRDFLTNNNLDALIAPTCYALNQPFGGVSYGSDCGNGLVNVLGVSGITVPMGVNAQGLPTGIQLWGQRWEEEEIINLGAQVEAVLQARIPTPLAPPMPGETIEYSTAVPPITRPEFAGPSLRIAAGAKVSGSGRKAALLLSGNAVDASGLASLQVYLNGRRVSAKAVPKWRASIPLAALRRLLPAGARSVNVQVIAKDIYGNTSVSTKAIKLPRTI